MGEFLIIISVVILALGSASIFANYSVRDKEKLKLYPYDEDSSPITYSVEGSDYSFTSFTVIGWKAATLKKVRNQIDCYVLKSGDILFIFICSRNGKYKTTARISRDHFIGRGFPNSDVPVNRKLLEHLKMKKGEETFS